VICAVGVNNIRCGDRQRGWKVGSLQTGPEDPDYYYLQPSHPLHPDAFGPNSIRHKVIIYASSRHLKCDEMGLKHVALSLTYKFHTLLDICVLACTCCYLRCAGQENHGHFAKESSGVHGSSSKVVVASRVAVFFGCCIRQEATLACTGSQNTATRIHLLKKCFSTLGVLTINATSYCVEQIVNKCCAAAACLQS
jgi:hypothetical protein